MSRSSSSRSRPIGSPAPSMTLEEREEDYKRMNAELEAQTAKLVQEADQVMRNQNSFLNSDPEDDTDDIPINPSNLSEDIMKELDSNDSALLSIAAGGFDTDLSDDIGSLMLMRSPSAPASRSAAPKRPPSVTRPISARFPTSNTKKKSVSFNKATAKSLAVRNIPSSMSMINDADVMPEGAGEMGTEAQLRLLKAKVHVLQEELAATTEELKSEAEGRAKLKNSMKETQDELERVRKSSNGQQNQIQKLKTQVEHEKKGAESKILQLQAANKELDANKREKKQQITAHSATEVRLNRALEELEKVKASLAKERNSNKDSTEKAAKEIEALKSNNKRLDRIKSECMNMMKKQQTLIGVLRKQIVHIEAAKLLSFTEDEFVKALDWEKA